MGKLQVVVGGQFGSEGKGAIAGWLARRAHTTQPVMAIRVGGPNAGHTVYNEAGVRFPLRQVPVAAVTNPEAMLAIGAGSEIDYEVLREEVQLLESNDVQVRDRLMVDDEATLLEERHRLAETGGKSRGTVGFDLVSRIGSTGKGIGACRADRIMRSAERIKDRAMLPWRVQAGNTARAAQEWLSGGGLVQVEAAQGFGLGLHAGYYPYCTSGDCRAIDALAMAGLSPWDDHVDEFEVWVVFRTYPIRVAGNSGPLAYEITWEDLATWSNGYIQPEHTTVTKKVRRVGKWDEDLARRAIAANGGPGVVRVALTMYDYWYPALSGYTTERDEVASLALDPIRNLGAELGVGIELIGTGPHSIIDRRA